MSEKNPILANPAPLGLAGFGMTTILLNLTNMGLFGVNSVIVAMGIFYGGLAQIIAGAMEFRKGNTFGTLAFTSYGLFWLTLVFIIISTVERPAVTPDNATWAAYLFIWGLFTLMMFFGTLKLNRALQTIFLTLAVLFFLLTASHFIPQLLPIAGVEGVFCGFCAFYTSMAEVLNETYKKTVLPIGPMKAE
ncbi:MAG TPA: acetate uptake transporter [Candidatus Acidoferrales bacterium]|nr:acetate uptake transporter [Candidatus Acidoferrales bacterium]